MQISGKWIKPEYENKAKMLLENMQVVHIDDEGNVYSDNELQNKIMGKDTLELNKNRK